MNKAQISISIFAIAFAVIMFNLPKVVVDNDAALAEAPVPSTSPNDSVESVLDIHGKKLSEEEKTLVNLLRDKIYNKENSVTFADSLASTFFELGKLDSAVKYMELAAAESQSVNYYQKAGDYAYEAYQYAVEESKRNKLGQKVRSYYQRVLDEENNLSRELRLSLKTSMAMTYLSTNSPMNGIAMLREVIEVDSTNEKALFNLGALSLQTRQYDLAIKRFNKVINLYPENTEAQLLLAISYYEAGEKGKAKEQFEYLRNMTDDPTIIEVVVDYLRKLK